MANRKLGKFEVTQAENGYILGMINTDYVPGNGAKAPYYTRTYVATSPEDLANQMVTLLVTERLEG